MAFRRFGGIQFVLVVGRNLLESFPVGIGVIAAAKRHARTICSCRNCLSLDMGGLDAPSHQCGPCVFVTLGRNERGPGFSDRRQYQHLDERRRPPSPSSFGIWTDPPTPSRAPRAITRPLPLPRAAPGYGRPARHEEAAASPRDRYQVRRLRRHRLSAGIELRPQINDLAKIVVPSFGRDPAPADIRTRARSI
jgi:hypothetical protein